MFTRSEMQPKTTGEAMRTDEWDAAELGSGVECNQCKNVPGMYSMICPRLELLEGPMAVDGVSGLVVFVLDWLCRRLWTWRLGVEVDVEERASGKILRWLKYAGERWTEESGPMQVVAVAGKRGPGSRIENPKQIQGLPSVRMHHRICLNGRSGQDETEAGEREEETERRGGGEDRRRSVATLVVDFGFGWCELVSKSAQATKQPTEPPSYADRQGRRDTRV